MFNGHDNGVYSDCIGEQTVMIRGLSRYFLTDGLGDFNQKSKENQRRKEYFKSTSTFGANIFVF
jgi:hypothetical protein